MPKESLLGNWLPSVPNLATSTPRSFRLSRTEGIFLRKILAEGEERKKRRALVFPRNNDRVPGACRTASRNLGT